MINLRAGVPPRGVSSQPWISRPSQCQRTSSMDTSSPMFAAEAGVIGCPAPGAPKTRCAGELNDSATYARVLPLALTDTRPSRASMVSGRTLSEGALWPLGSISAVPVDPYHVMPPSSLFPLQLTELTEPRNPLVTLSV